MYINDEVTAKMTKTNCVAFGRLHVNAWQRNEIKNDTKLKVYTLVVLPALVYAFETWAANNIVHGRKYDTSDHFCCRPRLDMTVDVLRLQQVFACYGIHITRTTAQVASFGIIPLKIIVFCLPFQDDTFI